MGHKFKVNDKVTRERGKEDAHWVMASECNDTGIFDVSELVGTGFIRLKGIPDFWNEGYFDLVESQ